MERLSARGCRFSMRSGRCFPANGPHTGKRSVIFLSRMDSHSTLFGPQNQRIRGDRMTNLRVIERLEQMLHMALEIIDEQAALLNQHGIETDDGKLEEAERQFRSDMEKWC